MLRRPYVRFPIAALCLFIAYGGFTRGLDTLFVEDDWSDDYTRGTAIIVASEERLTSDASMDARYDCQPVVEWSYAGQTRRKPLIWLGSTSSRSRRSADCASDGYGDEVPIWIKATPEPHVVQPGNRTAQPMSAAVNLIQGLVFLAIGGLLRFPRRNRDR